MPSKRHGPLTSLVPKVQSAKSRARAAPPVAAPSLNGRASKADIIVRKRRVAELMAEGKGAERTAQLLADECSIGIHQARIYVTEVRNEWAASEVDERPTHRARFVKVLETNAERALAEGDYAAVNGAIREMARITGLEVKTIAVGSMTPEQQALLDALKLTPVERAKRAADLRAKASSEAT